MTPIVGTEREEFIAGEVEEGTTGVSEAVSVASARRSSRIGCTEPGTATAPRLRTFRMGSTTQ